MLSLYCARTSPPLRADINIVDLKELFLHEEVVPNLLKRLMKEFEKSYFMLHPIIIDKRSRVVLDGTHRVQALRKLGFKHILACEVDYAHPAILVRRWFRIVHLKEKSREDLMCILREYSRNYDLELISLKRGVRDCLKEDVLLVKIPPETLALRSGRGISTVKAYILLRELEMRIIRSGYTIEYTIESIPSDTAEGNYAILIPRRISKEDVVETATKGILFPPKSTRHIIPIRPMFVNIPLRLLKSTLSLDLKRAIAKEYLEQRSVVRIRGGIKIDRLYEEEYLYIFI